MQDGIYRADAGYGVRGYATRHWVRVEGGRVVAVAHVNGHSLPELPAAWSTDNLRWHLSHFPGFDPTTEAFGSAGSRWKLVEELATATA